MAMHDPQTVAHEINWPWRRRNGYRSPIVTIWHVDPCRDGTDDSCGWFMRARHGDKKKLDRIASRFDFDWDRVFDPNKRDDDDSDYGDPRGNRQLVYTGYFRPEDGQPNLSPAAITVGLFHHAAGIHFDKTGNGFNWNAASKFVQRNLGEIIRFAENPMDSLVESIIRRHAVNCGEAYDPSTRKARIREFASIIYAWILRADRPWWKAPRWHIHHWRIQFHPWQNLKRRLWDKCCVCGKRGFPAGVSACGNWDGDKIWHSTCDSKIPRPAPTGAPACNR
jgi:hypothetical protein